MTAFFQYAESTWLKIASNTQLAEQWVKDSNESTYSGKEEKMQIFWKSFNHAQSSLTTMMPMMCTRTGFGGELSLCQRASLEKE